MLRESQDIQYTMYKLITTILIHSNIYKLLLIILLINQIANAQSLFFNQEQSNAILENLNKPKEKRKKKKVKRRVEYKVSGICYLSQSNWIVWINGKAYSRIGQYNHFSIDSVSKNSVTITTSDCKTMHLRVKCEDSNKIREKQ